MTETIFISAGQTRAYEQNRSHVGYGSSPRKPKFSSTSILAPISRTLTSALVCDFGVSGSRFLFWLVVATLHIGLVVCPSFAPVLRRKLTPTSSNFTQELPSACR